MSVFALFLLGQAPSGYGHVSEPLIPPTPERTASLRKVKSLAMATLMYAVDHKNTLPPARGFKAAIMPYLRDPSAFTAPGSPKGATDYFLDARLSGLGFSRIVWPAETAMIVEGRNGVARFPYGGVAALAYVDGHARLVDAARVRKARTHPLN